MPVCLQCLFFLGGNKYEFAFGEKTNCTNTTIHEYTCSHLLPFSGHRHKWCCVQTLGISDTQVPSLGVMIRHRVFEIPKYHLVLEYKVETTLYPRVDAVPEFWCKYSQKGLLTLLLSQNRALRPCIGTKFVNMPKNSTQGIWVKGDLTT